MQSNQAPADLTLPQLVADALVLEDERDTLTSSASRASSARSSTPPRTHALTPDVHVAYAVAMLCRVMGRPTPELHQDTLKVLAYLYARGTSACATRPTRYPSKASRTATGQLARPHR